MIKELKSSVPQVVHRGSTTLRRSSEPLTLKNQKMIVGVVTSRQPKFPVEIPIYAVQQDDIDDESSLEIPLSSDSDQDQEVYAGEHASEQPGTSEDEIQEVLEIQRQATGQKGVQAELQDLQGFQKESQRYQKGKTPYFPVVALNQPEGSGSAQQPSSSGAKGSGKVEKRTMNKSKNQRPPYSKREDAHLATGEQVTDFAYMVETNIQAMTATELDVLLASIPAGYAILDTGATTSVVGEDTAQRYEHFTAQGFPPPKSIELPPVELRGFNGQVEQTSSGLRWTVKLGSLHGTIVTYLVPGSTPFLLSRRVLENMQAVIDLGKQTITSQKHGMHEESLCRSANGHMLIAICPNQSELEDQQCETNEPNESATSTSECADAVSSSSESCPDVSAPPSSLRAEPGTEPSVAKQDHVSQKPVAPGKPKITTADRRRAFQTILKNTKNAIVDVKDKRKELEVIYGHNHGQDIVHALVGYKPKVERVPHDHNEMEYQCSIASLSKDGEFTVHPWQLRPAGIQRRSVNPMPVALFCYRPAVRSPEPSVQQPDTEPQCVGCCQHDAGEPHKHDHEPSIETLYEESDWVDVAPNSSLSPQSRKAIKHALDQLKHASTRMTLSKFVDNPKAVRAELDAWLGPQASQLDRPIGLIEVFTGKAQLSQTFERITGKASIKLGFEHGQDFNRVNDRRLLLLLIAYVQPDHVWFSWPCTHWGPWCHLNMSKSPEAKNEILKERALARGYLHMVSEAWHIQKAFSGHCHAENPLSSLAWNELNIGDVWTCRIDQCALGLRSPKNGNMILKPTKIGSTQQSLIQEISKYRCHGNHPHEHLAGSFKGQNLTKWAETYPSKFCRVMVTGMSHSMKHVERQPCHEVFEQEALEDIDMEAAADEQAVQNASSDSRQLNASEQRAVALVRRLHVNTGHSSPEQLMRLANRRQASDEIKEAIRTSKCPVCEELKPPPSYRKATLAHAEQPNQIVGLDFVQVELKRENAHGQMEEIKKNVLTCVCLATDFCQQVVVEPGRYGLSKAFHEVWVRPFGPPKTVFMDPDHRNISRDFQQYFVHNNIQLLLAGAESHWQLGKVETSNRVLRNMAVRTWRTTTRDPKETIEMCATVRNDYLRKCGFSPSQWFLGREPRHAASLADVDEQQNIASQSQVLADPEFASKVQLREEASKAFMEEHAKEVWRRAIAGRNRPMRGPYVVGQMVYMFRRAGRGQLSVRHSTWLGPGRIVGMESSRGGPIPRLIWVSHNGFLYRCSPEGLRPIPEDERRFKELIKEMSVGQLHPELEQAADTVAQRAGQFHDLIDHKPTDDDVELDDDLMDDPDDRPEDNEVSDPSMDQPRRVRVRFYRSPEYWRKRAAGEIGPHGALQEGQFQHWLNSLMPLKNTEMKNGTSCC